MGLRAACLVTFSTLGTIFGLTALAGGCSEDEPAETIEADGGGGADIVQRDAPPAGEAAPPFTRGACLAECEAKFPAGKSKDDALVACWTANCAGSCTPSASDAGVPEAGADAGSCRFPVTTFDPGCDLCTVSSCCAEWDGCFDDDVCVRYIGCTADCPAE
jgi:hypothetical protein